MPHAVVKDKAVGVVEQSRNALNVVVLAVVRADDLLVHGTDFTVDFQYAVAFLFCPFFHGCCLLFCRLRLFVCCTYDIIFRADVQWFCQNGLALFSVQID